MDECAEKAGNSRESPRLTLSSVLLASSLCLPGRLWRLLGVGGVGVEAAQVARVKVVAGTRWREKWGASGCTRKIMGSSTVATAAVAITLPGNVHPVVLGGETARSLALRGRGEGRAVFVGRSAELPLGQPKPTDLRPEGPLGLHRHVPPPGHPHSRCAGRPATPRRGSSVPSEVNPSEFRTYYGSIIPPDPRA